MKQICTISGMEVQAIHGFQKGMGALQALRKRTPILGQHWLFALSAQELCLLSSSCPAETLTPAERHILFLAIARATGCVDIEYPCTLALRGTPEEVETAATWDSLILRHMDRASALLRLLCSNAKSWRRALELEALPRLVLRKGDGKNLPEFLSGTLGPIAGAYIDAVAAGRALVLEPRDTLDDELQFERELKKALQFHGKKRAGALVEYTPTTGRKVLELLRQEFSNVLALGSPAGQAKYAQYRDILCLPPEKTVGKYPTSELRALQELISTIPAGLDSEDTIVRSYKLLSLRHLDSLISYEFTLGEMFGGATIRRQSQYSREAGVSWEVRELNLDPMAQALASLDSKPAVAPKAPASQNPLALKLKAKREALEAAALEALAAGTGAGGTSV